MSPVSNVAAFVFNEIIAIEDAFDQFFFSKGIDLYALNNIPTLHMLAQATMHIGYGTLKSLSALRKIYYAWKQKRSVKVAVEKLAKSEPYTGVGTIGIGVPREKISSDMLAQLIEDTTAPFGYRPKPESRFGGYNIEDMESVLNDRITRKEYLETSELLSKKIDEMTHAGKSKRDIVTEVCSMRNGDKVNARSHMTEEGIAILEEGNVIKYGDPVGPTPQWLFDEKAKAFRKAGIPYTDDDIWDAVIAGSMRKDPIVGIILGIEP